MLMQTTKQKTKLINSVDSDDNISEEKLVEQLQDFLNNKSYA